MRNMTSGSIYRHLLAYAIPLIFGNFLQLTYNAVDSILVSKGAGVAALSAVSVSNPVSVLLVQSISGLGIGASAYMSKLYGAGEGEWKRKMKTQSRQAFSTDEMPTKVTGVFESPTARSALDMMLYWKVKKLPRKRSRR